MKRWIVIPLLFLLACARIPSPIEMANAQPVGDEEEEGSFDPTFYDWGYREDVGDTICSDKAGRSVYEFVKQTEIRIPGGGMCVTFSSNAMISTKVPDEVEDKIHLGTLYQELPDWILSVKPSYVALPGDASEAGIGYLLEDLYTLEIQPPTNEEGATVIVCWEAQSIHGGNSTYEYGMRYRYQHHEKLTFMADKWNGIVIFVQYKSDRMQAEKYCLRWLWEKAHLLPVKRIVIDILVDPRFLGLPIQQYE